MFLWACLTLTGITQENAKAVICRQPADYDAHSFRFRLQLVIILLPGSVFCTASDPLVEGEIALMLVRALKY